VMMMAVTMMMVAMSVIVGVCHGGSR
jgi:hypothetical protein